MASNSETGHAINLANFKTMIDGCTQLGAAYQPNNTQITLPKLTASWTASSNAHKAVNDALTDTVKPVNDREILDAPLSKLMTRVFNNFKSCGANASAISDAKSVADDIRGFKVKIKKDKDNNPLPGQVSVSQMSFVNRQDNLSKLIGIIKKDGHYAPNEAELKVAVLETLSSNLKALNDGIGAILAPLTQNRGVRKQLMYEGPNNMMELERLVKNYCKGLPAEHAALVKNIVKLKFKKIED